MTGAPPERSASLGFVLMMAALMTVTAMSIDVNLPAIPAIARDLGSDATTAQLSVPLFFGGFALGQIVWGPLSDRSGRRPTMLVALGIYLASTVGCALAPSIETLLFFRVVQGFAAGGGSSIARVVIRDLYSGAEMARVMSLTMAAFITAPIVAPSIGALLLLVGPWRIIFLFLLIYGAILMVLAATRLEESLVQRNPHALRPAVMLAGYLAVLREPSSARPALVVILTMTAMQSYLTNAPAILMTMRGLSPNEFGLLFAVVAVFSALGNLANARAVRRMPLSRALRIGLVGSVLGALVNLIVVSVVPGSAWALAPGFAGFFFWFGWIVPNATTLFLTAHGSRVGTAVSALGIVQIAIPAIISATITLLHAQTPYPLLVTMLVAAGLATIVCFGDRHHY